MMAGYAVNVLSIIITVDASFAAKIFALQKRV